MATKKQTQAASNSSIELQLVHVGEVLKLCAFAAEARRILNEIEVAIELDDDLDFQLSNVEARKEWLQHEDNLGVVLKGLSHHIQNLVDQVQQTEAKDAIRS